MGQREDLLAGARRCLAERGYAHTTARDIVAVTGANLASIGYHFGSKEALLNAAIIETFEDWGDAIAQAVSAEPGKAPRQRLAGFLGKLLEVAPRQRAVVVASVQAYAQAEFAPAVREQLLRIYEEGRRDLAALVLDTQPDAVSERDARSIGSLCLALINGVMLQWLLDPEASPTAADIVRAIDVLTGGPR